jgi:hypothetical protein
MPRSSDNEGAEKAFALDVRRCPCIQGDRMLLYVKEIAQNVAQTRIFVNLSAKLCP